MEGGKVKATKRVLKNGKSIYPLGWINEIRDNEIVSSANKCICLKFTSKEQIIAFTEKLKNQQIGNIETYPAYNKGKAVRLPRTYVSITQWVERSKLDEFNDVKFSYDGDGYIKKILICPRKKTKVTNKFKGNQCGLHSDGTQYLTLDGRPYIGDFHIDPSLGAVTGTDNNEPKKQQLTSLYGLSPIGENSSTDFYLTTFGKKDVGLYSSFTANSISVNEPDKTYDLRISGSGFTATSAATGTTCIPISNINRSQILPMIGDANKQYKPYAFSEVYYNNNGSLTLDDTDPKHYMTYTVRSSGVYRFTYKAYLNINYTDTGWCGYVSRIAPSAVTATTGVYPQNDYQIKRLINTSIIRAGEGETNTILQDTGYKLHPGTRYWAGSEGSYLNSGILNFDFTASLLKYTTGATGTTSATPVTLDTFKILRCKEDGIADEYLTLNVSENDKFSNTYNMCIISGVSATTILNKQIPVIIDTGLINLTDGDIIELAYDLNWESKTKGIFDDIDYGGVTNMVTNLGHKLDATDTPIESPWYRGIKLSTKVICKNLFFDSTKKSKDFKMQVGGIPQTITLDGTLYMSDQVDGNIGRPNITPQTFRNQTFLDSTAPNSQLVWDHHSQTPTNNWQNLIVNNTIKDYTVPKCSTNLCPLTEMHKDGVFCFYLPTYNDEYGAKCDFTFPQIAQSYVVVNKFKNFFGGELTHYIVITPECNFYKPCSTTKLKSEYDILQQTRPDRWKIQNIDKKITINGKEITIISDTSSYYGKPLTLPNKTICKYFCDCGQNISERLNIVDPIYGITGVFTDLEANNCGECVSNSRTNCVKINKACKPVIIEDCSELKDYGEVTTESGIPIKLKGKLLASTITTGIPKSGPGVPTLYGCHEGVCMEEVGGIYSSIEICMANCEHQPYLNDGDDGNDPTRDAV
tara:strand:- start:1014 stop:3773 length:2760 start_codon:yes stop_codon:yes gene_type:complete